MEWKDTTEGKRYYKNQEKRKRIMRESYYRHRDRRIKEVKERELKLKQFLSQYKAFKGCFHCGIHEPLVLEFHHVRPEEKVNAVSRLIKRGSFKILEDEIAKCIVLCANCHRLEEYRLREAKKDIKKLSNIAELPSIGG